jgi:hypothetical protein
MSSSAFSLSLALPSEGFTITEGTPVLGGFRGATQHFFCPDCMSWMFTRPERMDQYVNLRLVNARRAAMGRAIHRGLDRRGVPVGKTAAVHCYTTQPDFEDYGRLIEDFSQRGACPP